MGLFSDLTAQGPVFTYSSRERSLTDAFEFPVLGLEIESFSPSSQPAGDPMKSDMAILRHSRIQSGSIGVSGDLSPTKHLWHYQNHFQAGVQQFWENPKLANDLAASGDCVVSYCNFKDG
jgi:hypothetical protein